MNPKGEEGRYFIVILMLGFWIQLSALGFGRFAYTVLLPGMKTDLALSNTHMGFFQVAILVGYLLFAFLSSALVKRWGLIATINLSVLVGGLAMTLLGFAAAFWHLLALAFWVGAGAAGSYIPMIPLLIGWSSTRRSGSAIGIVFSGCGVGILLSGFAASFLLIRYGLVGWRYTWIALGAVTILVALACLFFLKEKESSRGESAEHKNEHAALSLLWRDPSLRAIMAVYILVGFGYIMYGTFIVAYAVEEVGFSTAESGVIWSIFGLFSIAGCIFWGSASDRVGRKAVTMAALLLLSGSILLAILWRQKAGLYLSGGFFAFTFNGVITLIAAMFGDHIPVARMDRFFGVATLVHGLAQAVGVALAGWLKDLTSTFVVPFLLATVIIAICPVILIFLQERRKGEAL
ncbi:MAG: MFS transporter [Deltaproteobacteria bacterium]|nr:MFS transporter [Deltaproteobacteria bacterium]